MQARSAFSHHTNENTLLVQASKAKPSSRRAVLEDISNNTSNAVIIDANPTKDRPITRSLSRRDIPGPQPAAAHVPNQFKSQVQPESQTDPVDQDEEDDSWNHSALETSGDFHMSPASPVSSCRTITSFQRLSLDLLAPVDSEDLSKPQMVSEYAADIVRIWQVKELRKCVPCTYMRDVQTEINYKMRGILIDWLVEVHLKFKLVPETLFITTQLIDRFLARVPTVRPKLQLVGITAMLVACKYQEVYPPEINDFIYISDRAYNKPEILRMEETLLNTLDFNITSPSALSFAKRWLRVAGVLDTVRMHDMVQFLLELTIVDYNSLQFRPSLIAASSCVLAFRLCGHVADVNQVHVHSGYSLDDMHACTAHLSELVRGCGSGKLTAVFRKYSSSSKFGDVAGTALSGLQM